MKYDNDGPKTAWFETRLQSEVPLIEKMVICQTNHEGFYTSYQKCQCNQITFAQTRGEYNVNGMVL